MLFGHGGDVYSISKALGLTPEKVLDFSSNCSPLPYPEGFKEYLCDRIDQLHLLPEVDCVTIRGLLAKRYGLEPDNFLIGNGTTEWIYSLPRILKAKRAFIPYPTYADYEDACKAEGISVEALGTFQTGAARDERRLLDSLSNLDEGKLEKALIFICNPNNPTGLFISPVKLKSLIETRPKSATWIIDESYAPFVSQDDDSSLIAQKLPENVILLRSFSKIYGIPGLRVGCLVSRSRSMKHLRSLSRPWAVNRMAQLALEFLLVRPEFEQEVRRYCQREKTFLVNALSNDNMEYIEGRCHFALFALRGGLSAERITEVLKKKGILIRNCNNFKGLQGEHIRISPRLHHDNEFLVREINQSL